MKVFKMIPLFFLFFVLIFPCTSLHAATSDPLQIMNVRTNEQFYNSTNLVLNQNTPTRQGVESIEIYFNQPCTIGSVSLQDMQGNSIPLTQSQTFPASYQSSGWHFNVIQPNNVYPLKWNTSYVLTIHGGLSAGWQDSNGDFLPTDQTYTFTTSVAPVTNQYTFQIQHQDLYGVDDNHLFNAHYLSQTDSYPFHSLSGQISFDLNAEKNTEVMVRDAQGSLIYHQLFLDDNTGDSDKINIPQEGDYTLTIAPGSSSDQYATIRSIPEYSLNIQGPELQMNGTFPELYFQNENQYETHNSSFSIGLQTASGDTTSIDLMLDGKWVKTISDVRQSVLQAATFDPSQLANGIHELIFVAHASDSDNVVSYTRRFMVDRHSAFEDVSANFWGANVIDAMHALGIINGDTPTHFNTQGTITRAEFATMLVKTLKLPIDVGTTSTFSDVPSNAWYTPYVEAVYKAGYMVGQKQGNSMGFFPNQPITRSEAATVIGNSVVGSLTWQECSQLQDFSLVPGYAKGAVATLYYMAWMQGYPDGKFHPGNNMTRAEAAKLISHAVGM